MFDDIFDVFHLVVVEGGDFTGGWGEDFGSPRVAWSPAHGHFVAQIDTPLSTAQAQATPNGRRTTPSVAPSAVAASPMVSAS